MTCNDNLKLLLFTALFPLATVLTLCTSPCLRKQKYLNISGKQELLFILNIPERRFTAHEEKTGLLGTEIHLKKSQKMPNRLCVIPRQMTYLPSVHAQNPILGNGAQLSKMLNLSVKKADIF